jgi:excinuclease ABC subunit B
MFNGDRARKEALVEFGFRLPSAYDNRPLKFEEVYKKMNQVIFVSATPGKFEIQDANGDIVEQIIRPTGLLDPIITIKPAENQVDDALEEIRVETAKGAKVLVTTLTKKLAEDLTQYLNEIGVRAKYLHSEIDTLERVQIIKDLRMGLFDVLVGINLLREGLDIPEVSLVAILDADKEGFLRSETSLVQTCGRAARNVNGRVIMYADKMTESIKKCLNVTQNRRDKQEAFNKAHGITPQSVKRESVESLNETFSGQENNPDNIDKYQGMSKEQKIKMLQFEMKKAASEMRFEEAAQLREQIKKLIISN